MGFFGGDGVDDRGDGGGDGDDGVLGHVLVLVLVVQVSDAGDEEVLGGVREGVVDSFGDDCGNHWEYPASATPSQEPTIK